VPSAVGVSRDCDRFRHSLRDYRHPAHGVGGEELPMILAGSIL